MLHRAGCFSLDEDTNALLRTIPAFNICGSVTSIAKIFLAYYVGVLPFLPTGWLDGIFGIQLKRMTNLGRKTNPEYIETCSTSNIPFTNIYSELYPLLTIDGPGKSYLCAPLPFFRVPEASPSRE